MNQEIEAVEMTAEERDGIEKMMLAGLDKDVLNAMREKLGLDVKDEESARQALSCSLQARKFKNRVEIVRPHLDFQKAVMKICKDLFLNLEEIEKDFATKVTKWMHEQRDNPFTRIDEIEVEDGCLSTKTAYVYLVKDESAVPREFLAVDEAKVKAAIAQGVRNIPGLEIQTTQVAQLRVKN
jgi:predicted urease superfamily metal-dependent hydrolase